MRRVGLRVSALLLFVAGCHREGVDAKARPADAAGTPSVRASVASSGKDDAGSNVLADGSAGCPSEVSYVRPTPPGLVLRNAVAACVRDRRFEGPVFRDLAAALGSNLTEGQPPKCLAGYPPILLFTSDGTRADLHFCANVGTGTGFMDGSKLRVAKPDLVERWLKENVAPAPQGQ